MGGRTEKGGFVLLLHFGMVRILFLRRDCSALEVMRVITEKTVKSATTT